MKETQAKMEAKMKVKNSKNNFSVRIKLVTIQISPCGTEN